MIYEKLKREREAVQDYLPLITVAWKQEMTHVFETQITTYRSLSMQEDVHSAQVIHKIIIEMMHAHEQSVAHADELMEDKGPVPDLL